MAQIAQWGPKGFSISSKKIIPFTGLSTAYALKAMSNNDTSGTPSTNTMGRELQTISFETSYISALGVNPREEIGEWESLIGAFHSLHIGGKKFGPDKLQLTNVSVTDVQLNPKGEFIKANLSITLREYQPQEDKISSKKGTGAASNSKTGAFGNSVSQALSVEVKPTAGSMINKSLAMGAKPTKADKAAKKPKHT